MCWLCSCGHLHRPVLFMTLHICSKSTISFSDSSCPRRSGCPWGFPAASTLPLHIRVSSTRPIGCFFLPTQCGVISAHSFIQHLCPEHLLSVRGSSRSREFSVKWGANTSLRSLRAEGEDWWGIYLMQALAIVVVSSLKKNHTKQNIFFIVMKYPSDKMWHLTHFFENKFSGVMYLCIATQPSPFLSF